MRHHVTGISRTIAVTLAIVIVVAAVAGGYLLLPRTPSTKKVLVVGTTDSVASTLDPAEAYDYFGVNMVQNLGEGLWAYESNTGKLVNQLAKDHSVSGKAWTINLITNAKFQDGSTMDAESVKWSLERTISLNQDPAFLIADIIDKVDVTGQFQLRITLKQPYEETYVKALLSTWVAYPLNPKTTPKDKVMTPTTAPDVVGPYKVTRWEKDVVLELSSNPQYYGTKPKSEKVLIQFFKDAGALRLAIERGEIDMAFRTFAPADVKDLKTKPNLQVVSGPGVAPIRYMVFNLNIKPFDNKLVRQAFAYSIDRTRIRNTIFLVDLVQELYSMVPIGFFAHIDAFKERYGDKPNIARAKELLGQAGYTPTNKLKVELWYTTIRYTPVEGDVAAILKENLEATGLIEVTLKSADWATYRTIYKGDKAGVFLLGWFPDFLDSDNYVRPFYQSTGNGWLHVNYKNPTVDKLIDDQVLQITDKRKETLVEIQKIVAEDAPIIPVWQDGQYAVAKPNVKGIVLDTTQIFRYWLIFAEEK